MTDTTPTVPEWRPIETAPKDGAWVQIARPGEYLGAARWNGYCDGHAFDHATHWMPLPAPPELAREQQP